MGSYRTERLDSQFQQEISLIISRQLKDRCPDLSPIISVTEAKVAPDLKSAKIYISIYDTNEERKKRSFENLKENAGFIRSELFSVLHIRAIPELRFIMDESQEYGAKINQIINELEKNEKGKE